MHARSGRDGLRTAGGRGQGSGAGREFSPAPSVFDGIAALVDHNLIRREETAEGASNQQIADQLFIADRTAETNVRRLCRKLGVESRTAAVATAFSLGLIETTMS